LIKAVFAEFKHNRPDAGGCVGAVKTGWAEVVWESALQKVKRCYWKRLC